MQSKYRFLQKMCILIVRKQENVLIPTLFSFVCSAKAMIVASHKIKIQSRVDDIGSYS